ncbi:MAG: radical SAM protein [Thiolinea sp.]
MVTTASTTPYQPAERSCYAVWEITLKCNLACSHCGSRAGDARVNELSTTEALDLVHQMADVGVTEVTLIGGEAFLRKDWLEIAAEIHRCGMICSLTTGGYGITRTIAGRMKTAGINQVSVSVDGMRRTHDRLRGKIGSWQQAFATMQHLKAVGIPFGANTQVNRHSAREFPLLFQELTNAGANAWQVQMTVPMGNAADNSDILLQPDELLVFHPVLAYLAKKGHEQGFYIQPGNNFGYYGPYERLLRGMGSGNQWAFWNGCNAGLSTLGIEADGTIKGCPSLPTAAYSGGNIREQSLYDIVAQSEALTFNLKAGTPEGTDHLWGFCKTCEYAELCRGACNWTAHVFFDQRGNNPYCHHRSLVNAARGIRERVSIRRKASGLPFDNGVFDLHEQPYAADWDDGDKLRLTPESIQWPEQWLDEDEGLTNYVSQEIQQNIERLTPQYAA